MIRRTIGAGLVLAFAVPLLALAQDKLAARSDSGPRRLYSEVARTSLYVPVRDGTRLAVHIYRPAVNGKAVDTPYPVVFAFGPYPTRQRREDGSIAELATTPHFGLKGLTDYGYVVAIADVRGKGASFGSRRGFQDRTEAMDGHDLVQWLAGQPWSIGKVGMTGCSYLGGTTIHTASTSPPALKAIFVGASDIDKYVFVRRGGITAQYNTRPDEPLSDDLKSIPVDEDTDGSMLRAAVPEHAKNTPMAPLWYGMPYRDSISSLTGNRFWDEVGPYTYLNKLKSSGIATYFWDNWQDEPTEQIIFWAANLGGRLLVGPGSHCIPPPGYDFQGEIRRFFDRHLKGIDNGTEREPRYTWWVDEAPKESAWVRSNTLPGVGVPRQNWYLDGGTSGTARSVNDGLLSSARPKEGNDTLVVNYDVGEGEYFAYWPQPMNDKGLTYTSAPLTEDRQILGAPVLHLTLSSDRKEAIVFGYLEDVAPDGKGLVVTHGRLAASLRKLAKAPYDTLGLPWQSGLSSDVQPLSPGKPVEMSFAFLPASRVIKAGHRVRVTLAGADARQRNLAEIKESPPPRYTIRRGASRIEIPFVQK